ncbi:flagellar hook-length control protein FliK [Natranaerobius thermophilus]|uniref:Flagellar hook-length control protein-like C-terminal domain-containing protein n=1 Tax=Natranaerobius thermophilus (strain ATCC BAA-1301 / DSM 18059 / JW/NM-WN-LF) TaxID=457570 RepID=B2A0P5_NATTJ|nr:flagellar hook-length control protein FliK [Natranaerobius thermophilus]ACB85925.1 hypothetical protein Nther_2360 [Natranaerobius thermophilus JW/NM-WN-LF]
MIKFFPSSPLTGQNNLKLTSIADKIKEIFKPGNTVKARVAKSQGDRVILDLNNNLFQVKSEIPLSEGTWIKGRVYIDSSGTTYLQLLESQEEAELNAKTDRFFKEQGSRISDTPLHREIAKTVISMGKKPSPNLITELASFFPTVSQDQPAGSGTFSLNNLEEIVFLHLNKLPINDSTVATAKSFLNSATLNSQELSTSPLGDVFLIPQAQNWGEHGLPGQGSGLNTQGIKTSLTNVFKLFLTNQDQSSSLNLQGQAVQGGQGENGENHPGPQVQVTETSPGTRELSPFRLESSGQDQNNLLALLGMSRAINAIRNESGQPNLIQEPLFGFFLLQLNGEKAPGEFYISRFQRQQKGPGYNAKQGSSEITLGISLNPRQLGPLVIRIHFKSKVLSLQFTSHIEDTNKLISKHLPSLKQQLNKSGLTVARAETQTARMETPELQSRLARTPFTPEGNLDYKI